MVVEMSVNNSPNAERSWPALASVAALIMGALLLRAEGRSWVCACGRILIWAGDTCSANNSQQLLDPYSLTHVLHGFAYFWIITFAFTKLQPAWRLWLAITVGTAWEVFENTNFVIQRYRAETASLGYQGDTILNSFGDILCAVVGYMIARRIGLRRSLLAFVAVELVLLLWIKDSLLLQVLMLIRPVSAIKTWQLCG